MENFIPFFFCSLQPLVSCQYESLREKRARINSLEFGLEFVDSDGIKEENEKKTIGKEKEKKTSKKRSWQSLSREQIKRFPSFVKCQFENWSFLKAFQEAKSFPSSNEIFSRAQQEISLRDNLENFREKI